MKLIEIEKSEYKKFNKENKAHFMQSYEWGDVMKYKNYIPHYVGLVDNDQVVATALLLEKKMMKKLSYFYCPRGYTIDYKNEKLFKIFNDELIKYAKKNHAIFVKIDPDIKRHTLDIDGNIIEGESNEKLIERLKKLGYKHKGFNTEFVNEQPRFTFRLNLDNDFENIYSNIHATTRKILNKGNEYDLDVYKGTEDDIEDFYITMEETAKREGIVSNPIKYYLMFYKILHKAKMSDLYIVKVRMPKLIKYYENKIKEINNNIGTLKNNNNGNTKKTENKIKELENELAKINKDFDLAKQIKEEEMVLSSIITVKYNDMVWTIHGGNTTALRHLNSNYLLYYTIIKDAYNDGYKVIDFFGTSGNPNPSKDNPIYGIHNFKKRLGGEYTEFIGEFDLIVNKPMYLLYNVIIPVRRKIVKKILKMKNK